ncbi:unnamed protein product [Vicia faba]|uniref:Uncharacterized protein n=1 Tax=Vicia faba TaxID=3906 RepID=A0AAV0ZQS0_VICFA|nr:unnamed protein product [Vicia faba]
MSEDPPGKPSLLCTDDSVGARIMMFVLTKDTSSTRSATTSYSASCTTGFTMYSSTTDSTIETGVCTFSVGTCTFSIGVCTSVGACIYYTVDTLRPRRRGARNCTFYSVICFL